MFTSRWPTEASTQKRRCRLVGWLGVMFMFLFGVGGVGFGNRLGVCWLHHSTYLPTLPGVAEWGCLWSWGRVLTFRVHGGLVRGARVETAPAAFTPLNLLAIYSIFCLSLSLFLSCLFGSNSRFAALIDGTRGLMSGGFNGLAIFTIFIVSLGIAYLGVLSPSQHQHQHQRRCIISWWSIGLRSEAQAQHA